MSTCSGKAVVRDVRPDDVEALAAIAILAWTPIFATFRRIMTDELFEALRPDALADKARQVRAACAGERGLKVLVAELDGRVVGFVTFHANESTRVGEIGNNAVHPDFRGRGIAPAMYEEVFGRLRAQGMRHVEVGTGLDLAHAPARRAYEKVGFNIQLPAVRYFRKL